jgi:hypothetical protein
VVSREDWTSDMSEQERGNTKSPSDAKVTPPSVPYNGMVKLEKGILLVGSKNSCGLGLVIFRESTESFTTPNWARRQPQSVSAPPSAFSPPPSAHA